MRFMLAGNGQRKCTLRLVGECGRLEKEKSADVCGERMNGGKDSGRAEGHRRGP